MFASTLLLISVIIFFFVTGFYLLALQIKNNTVADIAWGIGIIVIAYATLFIHGTNSARQLLVTMLVLFWGVRLAAYIFIRSRGKNEDFRYKEWREKWGKSWKIKSYLQVFLLQGALMILVSFPVIFVNTYSTSSLGLFDRVGVFMWIIGFYFEAVGDYQLIRFKQNKKNEGKIMTTGLWKYTRHPNYFGESLMWWGIYAIALSNFNAWWTIVGPLFITYSLLKVSGVTLLEKKYQNNKSYQEYQKNTSSFIPWFPKHN
jgi:steroid 5-alpha reductase family enzyme